MVSVVTSSNLNADIKQLFAGRLHVPHHWQKWPYTKSSVQSVALPDATSDSYRQHCKSQFGPQFPLSHHCLTIISILQVCKINNLYSNS